MVLCVGRRKLTNDFEKEKAVSPTQPDDQVCPLLHTGYLCGHVGRGRGGRARVRARGTRFLPKVPAKGFPKSFHPEQGAAGVWTPSYAHRCWISSWAKKKNAMDCSARRGALTCAAELSSCSVVKTPSSEPLMGSMKGGGLAVPSPACQRACSGSRTSSEV